MKDKTLFMISLSIILLYALINSVNNVLTTSTEIKLPYVVLILCVVYLCFTNKYLLLPFLGETVIPISAIVDSKIPSGADSEYVLRLGDVTDGMKVIYWGAQKDDQKLYEDPYVAYDKYDNVGVAIIKDGTATLKYVKPAEYKVNGMKLPRHLHYRVCCRRNVMLGQVETIAL